MYVLVTAVLTATHIVELYVRTCYCSAHCYSYRGVVCTYLLLQCSLLLISWSCMYVLVTAVLTATHIVELYVCTCYCSAHCYSYRGVVCTYLLLQCSLLLISWSCMYVLVTAVLTATHIVELYVRTYLLLQCSLLLISWSCMYVLVTAVLTATHIVELYVRTCYCSPDTEDLSVGSGGVPVESEGVSAIAGTMSVASVNRERNDDVTKIDTPPSVRKGGGAGRRRGNFRIPPTSFQSFNPNGV